ncbi:MAG: hypothetical protein LBR55_05390, partial [Bacteroidales bacterium]|nr:hypothetical protein [Bacteroidales bacterium]
MNDKECVLCSSEIKKRRIMDLLTVLQGFVQVTVGASVAAPVEIAVEAPVEELSFWAMSLKGGWLMIPLVVLSIIAVYVIVERYLTISKAAKEDVLLMNEVKNYILQGKIDEARARCKSSATIVAAMVDKGITRIGKPLSDVREAIENVGRLEVAKLEKNLA